MDRFWKMVNKLPDDGCWEWTGARNKAGYGRFHPDSRTVAYAHRISWELEHGRPPAKQICHTCDNPKCVRPSHLFEGTQRDNIRDMMAKGRMRTVTSALSHRFSFKLTPEQMEQICAAVSSGTRRAVLADRYGISKRTIHRIVTRQGKGIVQS